MPAGIAVIAVSAGTVDASRIRLGVRRDKRVKA